LIGMLLAYTAAFEVVATLDWMVRYDPDGVPLGLIDFGAHEAAGGELTDIWRVTADDDPVVGSKVWPEWIGGRAHDFRVELEGPPGHKRIAALVHKTSGHRRERAAIEAAIENRIAEAAGAPADIRHLVGGPDRPLTLDDKGRTTARARVVEPNLPIVGIAAAADRRAEAAS
jgi:hypothetical protein